MRKPLPLLGRPSVPRRRTGDAASPSPRRSVQPVAGPTPSTPRRRPSATSPTMSGRTSSWATPPAGPATWPLPNAPTAPPCAANRATLAFVPNWPASGRPTLVPPRCPVRVDPAPASPDWRTSAKSRTFQLFRMSTKTQVSVNFLKAAVRHVPGRPPPTGRTTGGRAASPTTPSSAIARSITPSPATVRCSAVSSATIPSETVPRSTTRAALRSRTTTRPATTPRAGELLHFAEIERFAKLLDSVVRQPTGPPPTERRSATLREPVALGPAPDRQRSLGRRAPADPPKPAGHRSRRTLLGASSVSCPWQW